jgi:peroxiredoxin
MKNIRLKFLVCTVLGALAAPAFGDEVPDFTLLDHTGASHSLKRYFEAKAVTLIAYGSGLERAPLMALAKKYAGPEFPIFLIDGAGSEERPRQAAVAREFGIPVLADPKRIISRELGLKAPGQAVILSPAGWNPVFYGPWAGVSSALSRLAELKPVMLPSKEKEQVPFSAVASVIVDRCLQCHSAHDPVRLDQPKFIKEAAGQIRQSLLLGRMPPARADPFLGPYKIKDLTGEERLLLLKWVESGANYGPTDSVADRKDDSLNFEELGLHKIYSAQSDPHIIPKVGDTEFAFFQLGGPVPEKMSFSGYQLTAKNPELLANAALLVTSKPLEFYIGKATNTKFHNMCFDSSLYIVGALNGHENAVNPGFHRETIWHARRRGKGLVDNFELGARIGVSKGSFLILQAWRRRSNKEVPDQFTLDLFQYKGPKGPLISTRSLRALNIKIPAHAKSHVEPTSSLKIPEDMRISNLSVHMHTRGRAARVFYTSPSGKISTLATIPDFNYAAVAFGAIYPSTPIPVAKGSSISAECEYDNSKYNKYSPHPEGIVRFGMTSSGSEMCQIGVTFLGDYFPIQPGPKEEQTPVPGTGAAEGARRTPSAGAGGDASAGGQSRDADAAGEDSPSDADPHADVGAETHDYGHDP